MLFLNGEIWTVNNVTELNEIRKDYCTANEWHSLDTIDQKQCASKTNSQCKCLLYYNNKKLTKTSQ